MNSGPPRAETEAARQRRRLAQAINSLSQTPPSRHIPPARSDAQSRRQRGQATTRKPVRGSGPFSLATHEWRMVVCAGLKRTGAPNRPTRWVRRETSKPKSNSGSAPVRDRSRHNFGATRKAGRPERGSTRTAQFFWKRHCCQMNLLQALPAGANRVASISAASLSGSKGVLDPKAQVHARRGVTH
jgi:hypothetical protein